MIPALLAQIGLPLLVKAVGGALGSSSNPVAKAAGEALGAVEAEIRAGGLTAEDLAEANRHLEAMAGIEAETDRTWLREVNQTIRTEIASDDWYVRRMRPTFGYVVAVTWAAQMGAVAYIIATNPAAAGAVVSALGQLGTIWTVGLSVLAVSYTHLPANGDPGDPDRPYVNGDAQTGQEGSIPPAAAIEHPMREILAVIDAAGIPRDAEVLTQLNEAIDAKIAMARTISLLALASDAPIPNNVLTDIAWGSAPINDLGAWSAGAPTKLVVPAGCTMARISAQAVYYANATGQRYLRIEPTVSRGVSFEANIFPNSTASGGAVQVTTPLLPVTPGEEWKVQTSQGSGVSLSMILGRCWAVMEAY